MKRTYRSKKDTGGGLDHRDMLFNMDEKSSAFDAFYIQNIKQTKREQSCMGSSNNYGAASNRVRKRKYVKRLLKDVEPPPKDSTITLRESISASVYLTPDKSIHVNKAPDLFDQLLNSSPACSEEKQLKKVNLLYQMSGTLKEPKKYNRKKKQIKKFNISSSESSDFDKENSNKTNDTSMKNATDIRAHELIVEEAAQPSPKFDESINNIVKKLSQINNMKGNETFKCYKNRLTKNYQSPLLKTSPLCSTPFTEKSRSKSIYKFSPIPMGDLEESPNYETFMEDDRLVDKSIVFVPRNNSNALKRSHDEKSQVENELHTKFIGSSNPLFSSEADSHEKELKIEEPDKVPIDINSPETDRNIHLVCSQLSSLQTTEMEPFLGFSDETVAKVIENLPVVEVKDDSIIISTGKVSKSCQKSKENSVEHETKEYKTENKTVCNNTSAINYSTPPEPFFGFPEQSDSIIYISAGDNCLPCQSIVGCNEIVTHSLTVKSDGKVSDNTVLDNLVNHSLDHISFAENELHKVRETNVVAPKRSTILDSDDDEFEVLNVFNVSNSTAEQNASKIPEPYDVTPKCDKIETNNDECQILKNNDCNKETTLSSFSSLSEQDNHSSSERSVDELEDEFEYDDEHLAGQIASDSSSQGPKEEDDRQSLYDTCYSETSSIEGKAEKVPVIILKRMDKHLLVQYTKNVPLSVEPQVIVERMNTDLFKEYYENMPNISMVNSAQKQDEDESEDYASFNDSDYIPDELTDQESQSSNAERDLTSSESDADYYGQETNTDKVYKSFDDKCVNYVTTRKRNDYTNDSEITILDDSQISQDSTSTECDKTVLSNKNKKSFASPKNISSSFEAVSNENISEEEECDDDDTVSNKSPDTRMSFVTTRKSKLFRTSNAVRNCITSKTPDIQSGIILQPGKKWERSLSIYRRMTTMNDHFDRSLLEEREELHAKGRKYRQSVICTMEMQEKSLLHNESIQNRRSTFVSRPSRSTIRIVNETNTSRFSLSSTSVFEDLKGFLEDCDDTIVELSKLSLVDDHDVTVVEKFHDSGRSTTARDYVLRRCNQPDILPFDECYPDPLLKNCRKIGEGVYGEVFLWRAPDGLARVMKVVPIAGTVKVNGEPQKDFHEIIAEIVIAMELSALRAPLAGIECHFDEGKDADTLDLHSVENATDVFNKVLAVRCVYGNYPSRLLDLWELYDETVGSENDNPAILPPLQPYIVLELANAGQDLESYQFNSAEQAHALFLQVAFALAVGEEAFQFEHRDLHWGNVLIAPTDQKYATFVLRGRVHRVARRGVAATIIDYSLSRVCGPCGPRGERCALYNDLAADEGLFTAVGDYQFQVYRLMRDKLGNDWKNFEPYTNILWLHYTVDKMIAALRYKRTNTKTHKQYINKLKGIKERLLGYGSAAQFVLTDNE